MATNTIVVTDDSPTCSSTNNENLEMEELHVHEDFEEASALKSVLSRVASNDTKTVPETINIMLIGPTGAGKSTLINTIFGTEEAKVEHGGSACKHDNLVTPYHLPFVKMPDGRKMQIVIHDTVGFRESEKKDKALLKYIKHHVPKLHLLLVCHKLYDKVCDSTIKLLKLLAAHFTRDILNHTLFLLTHADAFVTTKAYRRSQGSDKEAIKEEFETRFENMKHLLNQAAIENFSKINGKNLRFCLTCDDTKFPLPNIDNWEYELWMFILHKCDEEAKVILSYWARIMRKMELQ